MATLYGVHARVAITMGKVRVRIVEFLHAPHHVSISFRNSTSVPRRASKVTLSLHRVVTESGYNSSAAV